MKLLDFGSARYSIGDKSKSLDVILKVGHAPKEQYIRRGRQGPFTDVYSCAACFYAALTGYLSPLSGMTRLKELYLFADNVSDLSFLSGMTQLVSLRIRTSHSSMEVRDLGPLADLTDLELLELRDNMDDEPLDITPLAGLTRLQSLQMRRAALLPWWS